MADAVPRELARLIAAADGAARDQAWEGFVATHSRLLLHVARSMTADHDAAMDAYAFMLEALRADDHRRLRAYTVQRASKFTTWLVVVARRLCLDRARQVHGRAR